MDSDNKPQIESDDVKSYDALVVSIFFYILLVGLFRSEVFTQRDCNFFTAFISWLSFHYFCIQKYFK